MIEALRTLAMQLGFFTAIFGAVKVITLLPRIYDSVPILKTTKGGAICPKTRPRARAQSAEESSA